MSREARSGRSDYLIVDGQHRIEELVRYLGKGVTYSIDAPADPSGEWWLELSIGTFSTSVSWRSDRGFGIYLTEDQGYGSRPDELFRDPVLAAKRIKQLTRPIAERASGSGMRLADLRSLMERQQVDVACKLNKNQAAISRLENQNDALLSTVRDYIEALGGEMRLLIRFDDFEAPLDIAASSCVARRRWVPERSSRRANPSAKLNLLVLRAKDPEKLAAFYGHLGLEFKAERHGSGAKHQTCFYNGATLEIYPSGKSQQTSSNTRIGFDVADVDAAFEAALSAGAEPLQSPRDGAWGRRAVLRDPEGHAVELSRTTD